VGRIELMRYRGDGTFEESYRAFGLDVPGVKSCDIFGEFDNYGYTDAMLGRSLQLCLYLEN